MDLQKSKKLLYIDPISPWGHINFNKIYINMLSRHFTQIDFAFRKEYEANFAIPGSSFIYSIPEKFYRKTDNRIINILNLLRVFKYIKINCNLQKYDFVLMASFEEIPLYLAHFNQPLILVHHNNFRSINNPIKLYFYRRVADKNINIVFEQYMKDTLDKLSICKSYVVHHGLPKPFNKDILEEGNMVHQFNDFNHFNFIMFSPSESSADKVFLTKLISSNIFIKFLEDKKILFILRGKFNNCLSSKNIRIMDTFLNEIQYKYLLLRSDIVIIAYPSSHRFRVSAILFECISNNKLCIISRIESFLQYENNFLYDPFFESIVELIDKIELITNLPDSLRNAPFENKGDLQPNFDEIFNKC